MGFESGPNYDDGPYDGLAVYCSDGRFSRSFHDFIVSGLGLVRCDRVVVPGGPAALGGRHDTDPEGLRLLDEIAFLCEAHEIDRVVLIQHDLCAFYLARLGATEESLRPLQLEDLAHAIDLTRVATGIERVEGYIARLVGRVVVFDEAMV